MTIVGVVDKVEHFAAKMYFVETKKCFVANGKPCVGVVPNFEGMKAHSLLVAF